MTFKNSRSTQFFPYIYYFNTQVGTNGIISFGQEWFFWDPELFPTSDYYIHNSYVIAPFWADIDTRAAGSVFYEVHQRGTNVGSNAVLERVSGFISAELSTSFTGSWMLVAQWDRVHPFPHGAEQSYSEEYGSFLDSVSVLKKIFLKFFIVNIIHDIFCKIGRHLPSCSGD